MLLLRLPAFDRFRLLLLCVEPLRDLLLFRSGRERPLLGNSLEDIALDDSCSLSLGFFFIVFFLIKTRCLPQTTTPNDLSYLADKALRFLLAPRPKPPTVAEAKASTTSSEHFHLAYLEPRTSAKAGG